MTDKIVDLIESAISGDTHVETAIAEIKELIKQEGTNRYNCCFRLLYAFRNKFLVDFCSHLRQSILMLGKSLKIKPEVFYKAAEERKVDFGFRFEGLHENIRISADTKIVPQETRISSIYEYKKRKTAERSIGDGKLYQYTKYPTYTTFSQKVLLNQISQMKEGDTLLASLPTGGGKSMSWQLPAIATDYGGLIIVIVPTIALAIDHARNSKLLWEKNNFNSNFPVAYHSGVRYQEKQEIKERIMSGKLPVLYISPEALMNNDFKQMIAEAAAEDKVSMLVVDEAHLVIGWAGFRPEFQLIASLRNRINKNSAKIKTVLLSATLNENDTNILMRMFASEGNWIEVRADALRPEIEYRMTTCEDEYHRKELTSALINQAPKPMIIYVMYKEIATNYLQQLQTYGYENVRMFTGDTGNEDRKRIIDEWAKDEVDIIVATSAFGMGVDKSDIRTIIHTFVPENVNRFFQETGRAGRDGYSALSYWLVYAADDKDNVRSMTSSEVPTSKTIADRWKAMRQKSEIIEGDCTWLNISVPPEHLQMQFTGKRSAGWNQSVLLFLFRNGFIDIVDVEAMPNKAEYRIKVQLLKIKDLEDFDRLESIVEPYRELERQYINKEQKLIEEMLKDKGCFSRYFVEEYPYAKEICSGCQYCINRDIGEFFDEGQIKLIFKKPRLVRIERNNGQLGMKLQMSDEVLLQRDDGYDLANTVKFLVENGVNNIVLPDCSQAMQESIVKSLVGYDAMLLSIWELTHYRVEQILVGITAVIIESTTGTKRIFEFAEKYLSVGRNKLVFVTSGGTIDRRKNKPLDETINSDCGKINYLV